MKAIAAIERLRERRDQLRSAYDVVRSADPNPLDGDGEVAQAARRSLRTTEMSPRLMRSLVGKLSRLIRRMETARRQDGKPPRANWFMSQSECNVAGKGKIRVKAQQRGDKPKRANQNAHH